MLKTDLNHIKMIKNNFKILSEETNRILELNSKLNKRISLNESTTRDLTVTVKGDKGELIAGAIVYDTDNSNAVNGATDANGNVVLQNFSGDTITIAFLGFATQIVTVDNSKTSIEVVLKQDAQLNTVDIIYTKPAKILVIDSTSKKPMENVKIILIKKIDDKDKYEGDGEKVEIYTGEDGTFIFEYDLYETSVTVSTKYGKQSFNLKRKEGETIESSDKIFKTIEFERYIQVKLQLKDSQTDELIPITKDVLDNIKIKIDDSTAFNSNANINEKLTEVDGDEIILDFSPLYISDSTKLIVKLDGYSASSVPLTSKPTGPIVVTLTDEVEEPERIKLPKGIRLGDVYESKTLYDVMRKYLGLCGEKYQEY
jgi:hypothetical protein